MPPVKVWSVLILCAFLENLSFSVSLCYMIFSFAHELEFAYAGKNHVPCETKKSENFLKTAQKDTAIFSYIVYGVQIAV